MVFRRLLPDNNIPDYRLLRRGEERQGGCLLVGTPFNHSLRGAKGLLTRHFYRPQIVFFVAESSAPAGFVPKRKLNIFNETGRGHRRIGL